LPDTITLGLIAGAFVGSTAGYIGSDALSHVALPGLALGILFSREMYTLWYRKCRQSSY